MFDLLKEAGKSSCKPINTGIEFNHGVRDAPDDPMVDRGLCQRFVRRLIYLAHTRPNIVFAMSVVS